MKIKEIQDYIKSRGVIKKYIVEATTEAFEKKLYTKSQIDHYLREHYNILLTHETITEDDRLLSNEVVSKLRATHKEEEIQDYKKWIRNIHTEPTLRVKPIYIWLIISIIVNVMGAIIISNCKVF